MQVQVNGIKLGVEKLGQGTPVVLIHGFPLTRAMWRPQMDALRDRFTFIAPDLRGFGESAGPTDDITMDTYAEDVIGLLDALEVERVALVGCSMGGYVAFRVMARAAPRIRALVMADSRAGPDSAEARERRYAAVRRIQTEGPEGFVNDFTSQLVGPTTKARRPAVVDEVRRIIGTPPPSSLAAALNALAARPDSRPLLPSISAPTLAIVGEEDTLTPPDAAREIATGVPAGRVVIIPQAGHLSNLEAPDAFNEALLGFLSE